MKVLPSEDINVDWLVLSSDYCKQETRAFIDRACVLCDGTGDGPIDHICEVCDGSGRYTFQVEVDESSGCGKCDPYTTHLINHEFGESCITINCFKLRPTSIYKVSVLPGKIFEIKLNDDRSYDVKPHILAGLLWSLAPTPHGGGYLTEKVELPPGAVPGKWVAQIKRKRI